MNKLWLFGLVFLLTIVSVMADNTTLIVGDNPFQYNTCPTTFAGAILYFLVGAVILVFLIISESVIKIPFLTILIGLGVIIWSTMGLWGCSHIIGMIGIAFGVGIAIMKVLVAFQ
jgi:hypothetical protein